jgi:hypothetical protein
MVPLQSESMYSMIALEAARSEPNRSSADIVESRCNFEKNTPVKNAR